MYRREQCRIQRWRQCWALLIGVLTDGGCQRISFQWAPQPGQAVTPNKTELKSNFTGCYLCSFPQKKKKHLTKSQPQGLPLTSGRNIDIFRAQYSVPPPSWLGAAMHSVRTWTLPVQKGPWLLCLLLTGTYVITEKAILCEAKGFWLGRMCLSIPFLVGQHEAEPCEDIQERREEENWHSGHSSKIACLNPGYKPARIYWQVCVCWAAAFSLYNHLCDCSWTENCAELGLHPDSQSSSSVRALKQHNK